MEGKSQKQDNRLKRALYLIADVFNDCILAKIILQALPILWTTVIVQVFHSTFYDVENGNLNGFGLAIAIILAVISIALLFLTDHKSNKDRKNKETIEKEIDSYRGEIELRRALSEAENVVQERKNRQFRQALEKISENDSVHMFARKALNPSERINSVFDELSECFSTLSGIARSEFTLSGAVAIANKNKKYTNESLNWEWISVPRLDGTASIHELIKNKSSFCIVANGQPYYYSNDKIDAAEKGEYFLDGRDKAYGGGSIICLELDEEIDKWRIRLILSISTYGKQIVDKSEIEDGANVTVVYEERIRDMIMKQFEGELKENLIWYAIERVDFEHGKLRREKNFIGKTDRYEK